LFPPRFQERLNLSSDQQKQVAALDVDVKAKLGNILTLEQFQQLNEMRPRRQTGPAGQGGSGPDGPDGQASGSQGGPGIGGEKPATGRPGDSVAPLAPEAGKFSMPKVGGFHLLAPRVQERLALNADQQKQVAALEIEVKGKLDTILTPEQLQQLDQLQPPQHRGDPSTSRPQPGSTDPAAPAPGVGSDTARP